MYLKLSIFLLLNFFILVQCKSNSNDQNRKTNNTKKEIKFSDNQNKNIIKEVGKKNIEIKNEKVNVESKTSDNTKEANKKDQLNNKQHIELNQPPQNFAVHNNQNPYYNQNMMPQNIINNSGSQNNKNQVSNSNSDNVNTSINKRTNINNKPNTLGINIRTNMPQQSSQIQGYNQTNNNSVGNNFANNQINNGASYINLQNPNYKPNYINPNINSRAAINIQTNNNLRKHTNLDENNNLEVINNDIKNKKKRETLEDYSNTEYENANKIYQRLKIILNKAYDDKILNKQLPTISITFKEALYKIADIGTVEALGYISTLLVYLNEKEAPPKSSGQKNYKKNKKWNKLDTKINKNFERDYKRIMKSDQGNKNLELNKATETKKGLQKIIADRKTLINQFKLPKSTDKKTELLKQHISIADSACKILLRGYFLKYLFSPNDEIETEYNEMIKPRIKNVINYNKKGILENIKDKCNLKKPKKSNKIKALEKRLNKRLNLLKKIMKLE